MIRTVLIIMSLGVSTLSYSSMAHAQEQEPLRNHADVGICADMHRMKKEANTGFQSYRGDLIDEGLSPYDSPRSGYTKKRYSTTKKITHNASSCEIWIPDNPEIYQNARYICHWDAGYAEQRQERFGFINDIFQTCFNYGEYMCVDVYGPRKICFIKNAQKGDTVIEWGEGISKDENNAPKYYAYFTIFEKTTK